MTARPAEDDARATSRAVVPRWEWRTFGEALGEAESGLAALTPERVEESDELYLLSVESDASVKVRAGLMDVKRLQRESDGLELWRPVLKAAFPLAAADVMQVLAALDVDAGELERPTYTLDELVADVVDPNPGLLAVAVHKARRHYTVGGCMAELTELRVGDGVTHTIAVENEDPARVIAAVTGLGLRSRRNVSLPRVLKALVGFGRRYAVIDIGTNSVKFHVGERSADGSWQTVVDRAEVTRLGEGLEQTGALGTVPMERTIDAIAEMVEQARRDAVAAVAAVGTAGLRIASNAGAFIEAVEARSGVRIEVISGEDEARLAYLGAASGLSLASGTVVVFDTGGGSSQFTLGRAQQIEERLSVDVGSVRFTERYGLEGVVSGDALAAASEAIRADLAPLDGWPRPEEVVGMGGAVTNLTAVEHGLRTYDPDVVQGSVLGRAELDRQIQLYRTSSVEQRRAIVGLQPNRAEVILAGALIVRTVLDKLGSDSLTVSDRGLRHGLIVERFSATKTSTAK